jgi:Helix-turn-helix domain
VAPPSGSVLDQARDQGPPAEPARAAVDRPQEPAAPEAPASGGAAADRPPAVPTPPHGPVAPAPIVLSTPVVPILLEREVAAPREPLVAEGGEWTGEMLRRVRESRGLTVQQVAERTRITRHHLENIEQERFPALPAPVYLRGIIMSLARELRLDGQKVARSYLDRMGLRTEGDARR